MTKISSLILAVIICFYSVSPLKAQGKAIKDIFQDVERINLKFGEVIFARFVDAAPLPDGNFVIIINESAFGEKYALVKISKTGDFIVKYDKRGNGPGEIRSIQNVAVAKDSILIAEHTAPFVHIFSHNLEFKKDYRIKKGGKIYLLGKYIGIWSLNYRKVNNIDKTYILALYDRNTFEFKKVTFEISEVPEYVHTWGGICRINNTYAGVYSTKYKIQVFDEDLNYKKSLITNIPKHIKKYYPSKKDPHHMDMSGQEWMKSWSKMHSIYYVDGKYIIKYLLENCRYIDIIDADGKILVANCKEGENRGILCTQNSYVWFLEWNNDRTRFAMIKSKINL